jgi:hypothetical protein
MLSMARREESRKIIHFASTECGRGHGAHVSQLAEDTNKKFDKHFESALHFA